MLSENFDASFLYDTFFWILTLGCLKWPFKPIFGKNFDQISKCPIFLDAMNLLKASKSHFLMVLKPNTLCPSLLITLYICEPLHHNMYT